MDERQFKEILTEAFNQEFSELTKGGEHRFSLRHRMRMRGVFRRYDRSRAVDLSIKTRPTLRRRLTVALIVVVTAVILAVTVIGIITNGFRFVEHEDHTQFDAVDIVDYPTSIEEIYEPTWIPEGFEMVELNEWRTVRETLYEYYNDHFLIRQHVKSTFLGYADSQKYQVEYILINGNTIAYWKNDDVNKIYWDNGDYIINIFGTITKEELLKLAESIKLKKVEISS